MCLGHVGCMAAVCVGWCVVVRGRWVVVVVGGTGAVVWACGGGGVWVGWGEGGLVVVVGMWRRDGTMRRCEHGVVIGW